LKSNINYCKRNGKFRISSHDERNPIKNLKSPIDRISNSNVQNK